MRGTWPQEQPILTDGVVVLRPWRPEDADAVFTACQDPDIRGITRRALQLATEWALTDGGFDTVVLEVEQHNPRSTAVVLAVGCQPADGLMDVQELKGSVRHFVHYRISRSDLDTSAAESGVQVQPHAMDDTESHLRALEPIGHRSPPGATRVAPAIGLATARPRRPEVVDTGGGSPDRPVKTPRGGAGGQGV